MVGSKALDASNLTHTKCRMLNPLTHSVGTWLRRNTRTRRCSRHPAHTLGRAWLLHGSYQTWIGLLALGLALLLKAVVKPLTQLLDGCATITTLLAT